MCLLSFISKYPTDHLLHHFENAYFEWKRKLTVFMHVTLNANELLLPAPFSKIGLCLYSSFHDRPPMVCRAEILRFKPYQLKF